MYRSCRLCVYVSFCCFFFKQKTAYELRISDWSSDVCSSDLEHLDLDMPRIGEIFLDVDGVVAECSLRLLLASRHHFRHLPGLGDNLHAASAAARRGLEQDGITDLPCDAQRLRLAVDQIGREPCRERVCQYV